MINRIVYTVTVIDLYTDKTVGLRRTPAIFTDKNEAIYVVKNNQHNLSDNLNYQFAVIEETLLNYVRPSMDMELNRWWYKHNSATGEFVECMCPPQLMNQSGFGIG